MIYMICGVIALAVTLYGVLAVQNIWKKVLLFLGIGAASTGFLWTQGEIAQAIVLHTFAVDYAQFVVIPIATVLIASLGLFTLNIDKGVKLGWLLGIGCPIVGNFATTWSLVPFGLCLIPALRRQYPDRWKGILVIKCAFSMNLLALGTLAADPPQALMALKGGARGNDLEFFFPLTVYWGWLGSTWYLYVKALGDHGVKLGFDPRTLVRGIRPKSWFKFILGLLIAAAVGFSVTKLRGYEITIALGALSLIVILLGFSLRKTFSHKERHNTWHWVLETVCVFVAFFSVVEFLHTGLTELTLSNDAMVGVTVGITLLADNAAAFAGAYPQYVELAPEFQLWYNLFVSVTVGGGLPTGNGPQIVFFLVILVNKGYFTPREVFATWFAEARVFAPYLGIWIVTSMIVVSSGIEMSGKLQVLIGLVAFSIAHSSSALKAQRRFFASQQQAHSEPPPETTPNDEAAPEASLEPTEEAPQPVSD